MANLDDKAAPPLNNRELPIHGENPGVAPHLRRKFHRICRGWTVTRRRSTIGFGGNLFGDFTVTSSITKKTASLIAFGVIAMVGTLFFTVDAVSNEHQTVRQCSSGDAFCVVKKATSVVNTSDQMTLSPWFAYAPLASNPASSSEVLPSGRGWAVTGISAGPTLDDNLSGNAQGSVWPGTGVEITSNGGLSWTQTLSDVNGFWGVESLGNDDVWALGVNTLYFSHNAGITWTKIQSNEAGGKNFVDVSFVTTSAGIALDSNGHVFSTSNAGNSWRESEYSLTPSDLPMESVANSQGRYYALDIDGNLWESADGSVFNLYATQPGAPTIRATRTSVGHFDAVGTFGGQLEISRGTIYVVGTGAGNTPIAYAVPAEPVRAGVRAQTSPDVARVSRLNGVINEFGRSILLTPVRSSTGLAFVANSSVAGKGGLLVFGGSRKVDPFAPYQSQSGVVAFSIHSVDIAGKNICVFATLVDTEGKETSVVAQSLDQGTNWSYQR